MADTMDLVFGALSDPTRRRLLDLLRRENGMPLRKLCDHLEMTRQGVSQHLAVLEKANLIVSYWDRREKLHFLEVAPLQKIYDKWLGKYL